MGNLKKLRTMNKLLFKMLTAMMVTLIWNNSISAQKEQSIKDLDFLIGKWEVREDNEEKTWWEKSVRTAKYALMDNYIELESRTIDSNRRERITLWFINYNKKKEQFEMASMFSNWYKTQFDILTWDKENRVLTIRNDPDCENGFPERFGEIIFSEDFQSYEWRGENKYGDKAKPSIWKYTEIGKRIE